MNTTALQPPGVRFVAVGPAPATSPLRSDIAAFVGPTRRGPIGVATRLEGWREFEVFYGGLDTRFDTPYAIRGYFENGGQTAYVIRVASGEPSTGCAAWRPTRPLWGLPVEGAELVATSPGSWSHGAQIELTWRREGPTQEPELDVAVRIDGREVETLVRLPAARLPEELERRSALIRARWLGPMPAAPGPRTPPRLDRAAVVLAVTTAERPAETVQYLAATDRLIDEPDVAIIAVPELHAARDTGPLDVAAIVHQLLAQAEALRDRLIVLDVPRDQRAGGTRVSWHADTLIADWLDAPAGLGRDLDRLDDRPWRAGAMYHPWLRVPDPLGGVHAPLRTVSPSGHVAGMISALDRSRGAHHTPANEPLLGVTDLESDVSPAEHAALNDAGVNLVRCTPGLGYAVMGGRTLDPRSDQRWIAHRRLIHRLVRVIRRVAEPLVFETNGPTLWFQFVRAVTTVLLSAWRSGALAGQRADEAFLVQCDAETNPPEEVDAGRCVCRIAVAPAVPMELIELRVALSRDGALEVLA